MKLKVFLAEAKLVQHELTGANGLYASMIPDEDSVARILGICEVLNLKPQVDELHVTVIYSKKAPDDLQAVQEIQAPTVDAYVTGVSHWKGHDDSTYIVLSLMSERLAELNAQYHAAGAEATFIPYAPHVTLHKQDDPLDDEQLQRIEALNKTLAAEFNKLTFVNLQAGDLDG